MVDGTADLPETKVINQEGAVLAEGVSFAEYLRLYDGQRAEWVAGKVVALVSNNTRHQRILLFLTHVFSYFFSLKALGEVFLAGVPMYIDDEHPARQPDIMVVLNEHADRIKENHVAAPADIALEIVSPGSTGLDRGVKFKEYEEAGVQEYWLIDPLRSDVVVYSLHEDGRYRSSQPNSDGYFESQVAQGLKIHPEWLWRETPPQGTELIRLVQTMTSEA